jgi:hypothetical protein
MPGLYTIINRKQGTIITGLIYNFDHQVHINGRTATKVQSFATSASQMDIQEDPAPAGTPSLPPALSGELSRLRFVLAAMKSLLLGTTVKWYIPLPGVSLITKGARVRRPTSQSIANSTNVAINYTGATVALSSPDFNTGVWSSGNPTRFTAPTDGLYLASAAVLWAPSGAGIFSRNLSIAINGNLAAAEAQKTKFTRNGVFQRMTIMAPVKLLAGDYVEFYVSQDTGSSLSLTATGSGTDDFFQSIVGSLIRLGHRA